MGLHMLCCYAGKPVFGTLIALLYNGEPIIGVLDQPITQERWVGVKGLGTTLNSKLYSLQTIYEFAHVWRYVAIQWSKV